MRAVMRVSVEKRVNSQPGAVRPDGLYHVTHHHSAAIPGFIEVFRCQSIEPFLIKDRSSSGPGWKSACALYRLRPTKIASSLVFKCSLDRSIIRYFLDYLH